MALSSVLRLLSSIFMPLDDNIDAAITLDPWRRKATTTARFELCFECKYYTPQKPFSPGVRCKFKLRPDVVFEEKKSVAKCPVFLKKSIKGEENEIV